MAPHPPDESPTTVAAPASRRGGRVGRVGQRVGPFLLEERLALHDAIGLYRASRPAGSRQPREVAIRIVEDARNDRAAAWVRHEYDVLVRLDHPGIPRAFGYYSSQVGVATSLPPVVTLASIFEARRGGQITLDVATSLDIALEVADILRHAHGVPGLDGPICHGHLAPATVGLAADGTVTVTGFGAAPGSLPIGYTPPEQVAGAFTDARSDQWRLGALIIELLLGVSLYADLDDPGAAAMEGLVQPWIRRLERRFPEVARVVTKLLSPAAGSRYDSDNTLVRDLLEASRHQGGRPDRRVLLSQMRALAEAEARRQAEAERPPEPEPTPEPAPPVAPEPAFTPAPQLPDPTPVPPEPEPPAPAPVESTDDPDSLDDSLDAPSLSEVLGNTGPPEHDPLADGPLPTPRLVPAPQPEVADPAAPPEPVAVAWEEDDEDDDSGMSLGLGRIQAPGSDGPSLGPILAIADDPGHEEPLAAVEDPLADPSMEVTEVMGATGIDPGTRPSPAGPRPAKWFPSELAAMAAIGVALIVAIVFMAWRFG